MHRFWLFTQALCNNWDVHMGSAILMATTAFACHGKSSQSELARQQDGCA